MNQMKLWKKLVTAGLIASMSIGLLAGCGGDKKKEEAVNLIPDLKK